MLMIRVTYRGCMTAERQATVRPRSPNPTEASPHRLGDLLEHAQLRYGAMTSAALAPLGIRALEWAAL
jgi:hypothetical protein